MKDNIDKAIESLETIFNEVDDGTLIESYAEEYQTIREALEAHKPKAHVFQPKDSAVIRDLAEALEEIREIYAGSEGFVAQTAPEAYQQRLLQKMCDRACKAVRDADTIAQEWMEREGYGCVSCGRKSDRETQDGADMCFECFGGFNASCVDELKKENSKLKIALYHHINADAYGSTFPDDEDDHKVLKKQETWNRLKARTFISDELEDSCSQEYKKHYSHKWEADGERCVKCGDKDWFNDPICSNSKAALADEGE